MTPFERFKDMMDNLSLYKIIQKNGYVTYIKALNNSSISDIEKRYYEKFKYDLSENLIDKIERVDGSEICVDDRDMIGDVNRQLEPYNDMSRYNTYFIKTPEEKIQKNHYVIALCGNHALYYLERKGYNVNNYSYYVVHDGSMI